MKKIYILFVLILFICVKNHAQTISGIITDNTSGEELIGVNIILENGNGTATDIFGKYKLRIEEGSQKIDSNKPDSQVDFEKTFPLLNRQQNPTSRIYR